MHPARKFSQNSCKTKNLTTEPTHNKQNQKVSVTQSFHKKFSLGNHGLSNESDHFQLQHRKSIADEKISVFLEHSQNRTFMFEKPNNDNDLKILNKLLQNQQGNLISILSQALQKNQFKSQQFKNMVCLLIQKLEDEQKSQSESSLDCSFRLHQNIMRPYLEQQMLLMQQNLTKLKKREKDIADVKALNDQDKKFLKKNLMMLYQQQKQQLQKFERIQKMQKIRV